MPSCSVPYCANASSKDSTLTFHEFPLQTPLFLNVWLKNIGRPNWRPGLRSVVCSQHFVKSDYDRSGKLRIGSFPSVFPEPPRKKKKVVEPVLKAGAKSDTSAAQTGCSIPLPCLKATGVAASTPSNTIKNAEQNTRPTNQPIIVKSEIKNPCEPDIIVKVENTDVLCSQARDSSETDLGKISQTNTSVAMVTEASQSAAQRSTSQSDCLKLNDALSFREPNICQTDENLHPKTTVADLREKLNENLITKTKRNEPNVLKSIPVTGVSSTFSLLSCRICGHTSSSNTPIFNKDGSRSDLADLINAYLPIKVSQSDSIPLNICDSCIAQLKACQNMISCCQRTDNILHGRDINSPLATATGSATSQNKARNQIENSASNLKSIPKQMIMDSGDDVVLQQTLTNKSSGKEVSRILLLEMPCQEQVPVKVMITQAIEELKLRLQPKIVRKSKPHGRIMFLDLQGGKAAYPEQMSKAVSMMFANGTTEGNKKKISIPALATSRKPEAAGASPLLVKIAPSPSQATPVVPALPVTALPVTLPAIQISSGPVPASDFAPDFPPDFPLTCNTLPLTMPPLPPPSSFPSSVLRFGPGPSLGNFPRLVPVSLSNTKNVEGTGIPSLVPISENDNNAVKNYDFTTKPPPLDVASLREKMLTKINNKGKQFKLGDKIVGIVVRNSESSEEIQKKLQATFSKSTVATKPGTKPKERLIHPKGVAEVNAGTLNSETVVIPDFVENVKKPKEPILDICSSPDELCSYYERRHSPKLTLSFMWRKTAYLPSSYQKLFTWVPPFGPGTMPVLSCRVCFRTVTNKCEVETHLLSHPELQCTVCQKYFLTVDKVREHVNVIHLLAPHDMPKKKSFVIWRQNALRRHVLKQFQCSRCERRYKQKEGLERHAVVCKQRTLAEKVIAISNTNLISCPVCNKNMLTNAALQEHMLVHTKRTSWLCDICGQVLKTQSNYRSHTARHEELAHQFKYQCKVCKRRFKLLNRFTEHEKSHEVERQFMCQSCGKVFRTLNGLRQHEILHGERKLQCRFCPSRFHRRDHLRIHEACHNKPANKSQMPRNFRCRFCPTSVDSGRFPNMRQLMDHYAQVHELERGKIPGSHKYSCDRCPRTFINSTLLRHHYLWHDGDRPYHCSICGQGFMVKERLRNHENIHTNERPHKCQQCGKGFRSRHVLKQHKKVHSDPSTHFYCKFCKKGFSRIDNLRTHELVHTGVKPWRCAVCLRQFRIRADCAKHISVTHQLSPSDVQLNIENATETPDPESVEDPEPVEEPAKTISTVDTIEFLLEDDELEEEEAAIE